MKKLMFFAVLIAALSSCAFAQALWQGAKLAGTFPDVARVIESGASDGGYTETMLVFEGYIEITLARFPDAAAREAYLEVFRPEMEIEIIEDDYTVAGCEALHARYMAVRDGDLGQVDSFCFETETDCFLFLAFAKETDWADYEFARNAEYNHYRDWVDQWAQSLEICMP